MDPPAFEIFSHRFENSLNPGSFDEILLWEEFPEVIRSLWKCPEKKRLALVSEFWLWCIAGCGEGTGEWGNGWESEVKKVRGMKLAEMLVRMYE